MRNWIQQRLSKLAEWCGVGLGAVLPPGECVVVWRQKSGHYAYNVVDARAPFGRRFRAGAAGMPYAPDVDRIVRGLKSVEE